jgi:hypothetical protein
MHKLRLERTNNKQGGNQLRVWPPPHAANHMAGRTPTPPHAPQAKHVGGASSNIGDNTPSTVQVGGMRSSPPWQPAVVLLGIPAPRNGVRHEEPICVVSRRNLVPRQILLPRQMKWFPGKFANLVCRQFWCPGIALIRRGDTDVDPLTQTTQH